MTDKKTIEERIADYEQIKQDAAILYKTFISVNCPALDQEIRFTSEGFNHLVYGAPKKMRDKKAQILRFDMLEKAKFILETSTTFQEYDEEIIYKKVNRRGFWVPMNVIIRRWGFVAMVPKFRVKVVITQEGNGTIEFLSVAPAWFTKQYRDIKMIQTSTGKGLKSSDDEEVLKNAAISDIL
ncbi:MAG: hypothetical protein U1C12_01070 [Patescibacteria group bacterium]|nr:hypothetical protein [Patescibacteria group bacterium]